MPHKLSRNLAFMMSNEKERIITKYARSTKWNPANPQKPNLQQVARARQAESFQLNAINALDEVIRMAEGEGQLTLGRSVFVPRRSARYWSQR